MSNPNSGTIFLQKQGTPWYVWLLTPPWENKGVYKKMCVYGYVCVCILYMYIHINFTSYYIIIYIYHKQTEWGTQAVKKTNHRKGLSKATWFFHLNPGTVRGSPLVVHPLLRSQTAVAEVLELVDPIAPGLPGEGMKWIGSLDHWIGFAGKINRKIYRKAMVFTCFYHSICDKKLEIFP